jgi:hypothetical protein
VDENREVRERFEAELAQRGLTSVIPPEAYLHRDYEFAPVTV